MHSALLDMDCIGNVDGHDGINLVLLSTPVALVLSKTSVVFHTLSAIKLLVHSMGPA